jgi:hypothetical protein
MFVSFRSDVFPVQTDPLLPGTKRQFLGALVGACFSPALLAASSPSAPATLTAAQIVDKHVTARGGLQAWRAVQAMSFNGKMEAGTANSIARSVRVARGGRGRANRPTSAEVSASTTKVAAEQQAQLPFVLEMKSPRKSRLEIEFAGKTAVQVYDGVKGWKVRPFLNRNEVEPFTEEEAKAEAGKPDIMGPLIDYAAKGTKVTLEGSEAVEGRNAYKLKLITKGGDARHIWIDAQNFLDVKVEGVPRRMDGKMRSVWIYQRDFKPVQGLMMPFVMETAIDGYHETHKIIVEKAAVNPKLADSLFAKPKV